MLLQGCLPFQSLVFERSVLRGLIKCPATASIIREKAIFISLSLKGCSILEPLEAYQTTVHSFKSVIKNSLELATTLPISTILAFEGWRQED